MQNSAYRVVSVICVRKKVIYLWKDTQEADNKDCNGEGNWIATSIVGEQDFSLYTHSFVFEPYEYISYLKF